MATILVAEDDISVRNILSRIIDSMGHTSLLCPNGKVAWQILNASTDIDMVIADIVMPELDGKKLVNLIRSRNEFKNIPVIILSGIISVSEVSDLLELGAINFISKPISLISLEATISSLLKSR